MPGKKPASAIPSSKRMVMKLWPPLTAAVAPGDDSPGDHDARDPAPRADPLEDQIRGHFEHKVPDEEDAGAEGVHRIVDAQRGIHRELREAHVHSIQIADDEQDDQQGQQAAAHPCEHGCTIHADGRGDRGHGSLGSAHRVAGVERRSLRLSMARSCSSSSTRKTSTHPTKANAPAVMVVSSHASFGKKA